MAKRFKGWKRRNTGLRLCRQPPNQDSSSEFNRRLVVNSVSGLVRGNIRQCRFQKYSSTPECTGGPSRQREWGFHGADRGGNLHMEKSELVQCCSNCCSAPPPRTCLDLALQRRWQEVHCWGNYVKWGRDGLKGALEGQLEGEVEKEILIQLQHSSMCIHTHHGLLKPL